MTDSEGYELYCRCFRHREYNLEERGAIAGAMRLVVDADTPEAAVPIILWWGWGRSGENKKACLRAVLRIRARWAQMQGAKA